jgi:hypothetical protein
MLQHPNVQYFLVNEEFMADSAKFRAIMQSYHDIYKYKGLIHKCQMAYVFCQHPRFRAVIETVKQFCTDNNIFLYNDMDFVGNAIVCRKTFVETFDRELKKYNETAEEKVGVTQPQFVFIEPNGRTAEEIASDPEIVERLDQMEFPVILKPRIASYVPHAHSMVIVRDK